MLESLGATADDDALERFVRAENLVWRPRHALEPTVLDLLDALRERGLKVGLVSNLFDPPQLMRELFAEIGLLDRLDAIAVSAEVGKRKPSPAIFEAALAQAGVAPDQAVMVGDRLREDVGGAQAVGMASIQATWFADDESGARDAGCTCLRACRCLAIPRHNLIIGCLSRLAETGPLLSPSRA